MLAYPSSSIHSAFQFIFFFSSSSIYSTLYYTLQQAITSDSVSKLSLFSFSNSIQTALSFPLPLSTLLHFFFHSTLLIFSILLHIHISNAFILLISSIVNYHVSNSYKRTLQITVLIIFFVTVLLIPLVSSSLLLLKAVFAIPILVLSSLLQLPLSVIIDPN